jgi:type III pantothenate kinase
VAVEASACGRPVFGSSIGGIPEVIEDGKTGLVLPPGDVRAWSNALRSYAKQVSQLRTMGELARRRVELLFDSKGFAKRMLELYGIAMNEPIQLEKKGTIQSSRRDHEG